MKPARTPKLVAHAAAAFSFYVSSAAHAYNISDGPCGGDHYWDPGSEGIRLGTVPDGTWAFNTNDLSSQASGASAVGDAIAAWGRYSPIMDWFMFRSSSTFNPSGTGWFDDGNEISNVWFETLDSIPNMGPGGAALARTIFDHYTCFFPGVESTIIAADIVINHDGFKNMVNQNTLDECFETAGSSSVEWMALHELGHLIGLGHEESRIGVMNTVRRNHHHCALQRTFSDRPYPDDVQGYRRHHDAPGSTIDFNLSGTPWIRTSTASLFTSVDEEIANHDEKLITLQMTLDSDEGHGNQTLIKMMWVADGQIPAFLNGAWTAGCSAVMANNCAAFGCGCVNNACSGAFCPNRPIPQNVTFWTPSSSTSGISDIVTTTARVFGSQFHPGVFRLWVIVNPDGFNGEIDPFDNVFPTDVMLERLP
jgi:hypothetical protein